MKKSLANTPKYSLKEFKNEDEISQFFKENLSLIFPNLRHIETPWRIPYCDLDDNEGIVDALAFHCKKGERIKPVLLEYKHTDQKNPIGQLLGYFNTLRDNPGNFDRLEKRYHRKNSWGGNEYFS